jgi:DNA-directed RNA polymerase specialized sigma subunit
MNYYGCISNLRPESSPNEPSPTTEWNIQQLAIAVSQDGLKSDEAADLLITENMRLIGAAITKFTSLHQDAEYLIDDMFSEGLLALTKSIRVLVRHYKADPDKLRHFMENLDKTPNEKFNLLGYIYMSIYRAIQKCYEIDSSNPISARIRHKHTPKGASKPTRQVDMSPEYFVHLSEDTFNEIYLMEDIEGACVNDMEVNIAHLRSDGLTIQETADELGVSHATVWRGKNSIYARYCKQQGLSK